MKTEYAIQLCTWGFSVWHKVVENKFLARFLVSSAGNFNMSPMQVFFAILLFVFM